MDTILVHLVTLSAPVPALSIQKLIADAGPVVKFVLALLVLMSVVSWYIIAYKALALRRARAETQVFLEAFWQSKQLDAIFQTSETLRNSPVSQVFRAGYIELSKLKSGARQGDTMHGVLGDLENIERALNRAQNTERVALESMTGWLATTASAAPFVGLFGTVWGIMRSFKDLGLDVESGGSGGSAAVMSGISEALIATAVGIIVAVEAVVLFNIFQARLSRLAAEFRLIAEEFVELLREAAPNGKLPVTTDAQPPTAS
jgi:biopolymer transport protein TolQ